MRGLPLRQNRCIEVGGKAAQLEVGGVCDDGLEGLCGDGAPGVRIAAHDARAREPDTQKNANSDAQGPRACLTVRATTFEVGGKAAPEAGGVRGAGLEVAPAAECATLEGLCGRAVRNNLWSSESRLAECAAPEGLRARATPRARAATCVDCTIRVGRPGQHLGAVHLRARAPPAMNTELLLTLLRTLETHALDNAAALRALETHALKNAAALRALAEQ
eukprot:scaffold6188_cov99-Isochrysis_galbana.AAC.3